MSCEYWFRYTPYPFVLDFWKIKFEKSISTNWIFNLQKSILKLIFAGCTSSKNPVWNTVFFQLDFSKIKYRWIGRLNIKYTWAIVSNFINSASELQPNHLSRQILYYARCGLFLTSRPLYPLQKTSFAFHDYLNFKHAI